MGLPFINGLIAGITPIDRRTVPDHLADGPNFGGAKVGEIDQLWMVGGIVRFRGERDAVVVEDDAPDGNRRVVDRYGVEAVRGRG